MSGDDRPAHADGSGRDASSLDAATLDAVRRFVREGRLASTSPLGFAAIVGDNDVDYRGTRRTARVADVAALGELLQAAADALDR